MENEYLEEIKDSLKELGIETDFAFENLSRDIRVARLDFVEGTHLRIRMNDGMTYEYPMSVAYDGEMRINKTWFLLVTWMVRWDETAINAISNFITGILYPVSLALSFDDTYVGELRDATISALKRGAEQVNNDQDGTEKDLHLHAGGSGGKD